MKQILLIVPLFLFVIGCGKDDETKTYRCIDDHTMEQMHPSGKPMTVHCEYGCKKGGCLNSEAEHCESGCFSNSLFICDSRGVQKRVYCEMSCNEEGYCEGAERYSCSEDCQDCQHGICITEIMRQVKEGDSCSPYAFNAYCLDEKAVNCNGGKIEIQSCDEAPGCAVVGNYYYYNSLGGTETHLDYSTSNAYAVCSDHIESCEESFKNTPRQLGYSYCYTENGQSYQTFVSCVRNSDGYFSAVESVQRYACDSKGCDTENNRCFEYAEHYDSVCYNGMLFTGLKSEKCQQRCAFINGKGSCYAWTCTDDSKRPEIWCEGENNQTMRYRGCRIDDFGQNLYVNDEYECENMCANGLGCVSSVP